MSSDQPNKNAETNAAEENETQASTTENANEHADSASETTSADAAKATAAEGDASAERVAELELALNNAEQQAHENREKALRAVAEMENIRRRSAQEVDKAHKFALEKFANELLTTVDNLERALQLADQTDESAKNFIEGIELTYKSLVSTLEKFGVEAVGAEGDNFNPDLHQAMAMQESSEHANNTVMAVMQKGYTLSGRLLRPAMVMVARNSDSGVDTKA